MRPPSEFRLERVAQRNPIDHVRKPEYELSRALTLTAVSEWSSKGRTAPSEMSMQFHRAGSSSAFIESAITIH